MVAVYLLLLIACNEPEADTGDTGTPDIECRSPHCDVLPVVPQEVE